MGTHVHKSHFLENEITLSQISASSGRLTQLVISAGSVLHGVDAAQFIPPRPS